MQHTTPCDACPFLRKNAGMIRGARAEELSDALQRDIHFNCHKTIDYTKGEGEGRTTKATRICVGSMITTDRSAVAPSQLARIYARIGVLNYKNIEESKADCFDSFDEFIEAHTEKENV